MKNLIYCANKKYIDNIKDIVKNNFLINYFDIIYNFDNENKYDIKLYDNLIFCLPEWNGSYPWFFKKWIDLQEYNSFKDKNVYFILWSSGNNKALCLKNSLLILCNSLKMNIMNKNYYINMI